MATHEEELRAIHLADQAERFGCQVETYPDNNAVFLRNLPGDLQSDVNFEQFVESCHAHNVAACRTWRESEKQS